MNSIDSSELSTVIKMFIRQLLFRIRCSRKKTGLLKYYMLYSSGSSGDHLVSPECSMRSIMQWEAEDKTYDLSTGL